MRLIATWFTDDSQTGKLEYLGIIIIVRKNHPSPQNGRTLDYQQVIHHPRNRTHFAETNGTAPNRKKFIKVFNLCLLRIANHDLSKNKNISVLCLLICGFGA